MILYHNENDCHNFIFHQFLTDVIWQRGFIGVFIFARGKKIIILIAYASFLALMPKVQRWGWSVIS
jgi:hypothetical protein